MISEVKSGACILLKKKKKNQKNMTWLACHHYILEMMLEAVFLLSVGPSKSPGIMILKQFQSKWSIIDEARYQVAASDDVTYIVSPLLKKI